MVIRLKRGNVSWKNKVSRGQWCLFSSSYSPRLTVIDKQKSCTAENSLKSIATLRSWKERYPTLEQDVKNKHSMSNQEQTSKMTGLQRNLFLDGQHCLQEQRRRQEKGLPHVGDEGTVGRQGVGAPLLADVPHSNLLTAKKTERQCIGGTLVAVGVFLYFWYTGKLVGHNAR